MQTFDQWISKNYPMFMLTWDREEDATSRLVRIVGNDLYTQLAEAISLLIEARSDLPLAAAAWNDDPDQGVADFHRNRVMGLVRNIDAALDRSRPAALIDKAVAGKQEIDRI